ncbi:MAG: helix-turn-helix domain-containing protein [Paludibacter sp.]|nr:helix-turn-helix domain-containing protein [Paludibacter sp.]
MTNFNMPFSDIINLISEQVAEKVLQNLNLSNSSTENVFMNIDETSKLIDLTKPTVYGLVHKNKIPYHKKGKRLYFLKSEILTWLKSGKHQTKSELEVQADAYLLKNKLF